MEKRIKVYQMSEEEYFAGYNKTSVRVAYRNFLKDMLNPKDVKVALNDSVDYWLGNNLNPLSALQMQKLKLRTDDRGGEESTLLTFAEALKVIIKEKCPMPMLFCQPD